MSSVLNVEVRDQIGTSRVKRLRASGKVPAVIYGHGGETVSLAVAEEQIHGVIKSGDRVVKLAGGAEGDAFIKDVQWDTFGSKVLHVDFSRVSAEEAIETTVTLELRGDAPGTHDLLLAAPPVVIPSIWQDVTQRPATPASNSPPVRSSA